MSDETDTLLRQILETQRQHLDEFKKEITRVSDYRLSLMETQMVIMRRQFLAIAFVGLFIIGGFGLLGLVSMGVQFQRTQPVPLPVYGTASVSPASSM